VIKIPALLFLFLVEVIFICAGLAVFFFIRHRKISIKATIAGGEIRRLESEIGKQQGEVETLSGYPKMYEEMREKLEQIQAINSKLKETVEALVPEAERSKEFEQMLAEIDEHNKELNAAIGSLQNEKETLSQSKQYFKKEAEGLAGKLRDSVKRDDYQHVMSEKKSLELKVESLQAEVDQKTKALEKLEKNYIYLEKEYNALYRNIKGEDPQ